MDAAFRGDVDGFVDDLNERPVAGWGGFTGMSIVGDKRAPESVPTATARWLFAFRRQHDWPPRVTPGSDWGRRYDAAREGLPEELVRPTVAEAAAWAYAL